MISKYLKFIYNTWVIVSTSILLNFVQFLIYLVYLFVDKVLKLKPSAQKIRQFIARSCQIFTNNFIYLIGLDEQSVIVSGEEICPSESCLVLINHRHHADFIYIFLVSALLKLQDNQKCFLKDILKYVPVIGPTNLAAGCCFLKRSLAKDAVKITEYFKNLMESTKKSDSNNFCFVTFIEGTRITEEKRIFSNQMAQQKFGLKPLQHLLQLKPAGYQLIQKTVKFQVPTYFVTLLFQRNGEKTYDKVGPTLFDLLSGEHSKLGKIHIQFKRFYNDDSSDIVKSLNDEWQEIDYEIEEFNKNGRFSSPKADLLKDNSIYQKSRFTFYVSSVVSIFFAKILAYEVFSKMSWWSINFILLCSCFLMLLARRLSDPSKSSKILIEKGK